MSKKTVAILGASADPSKFGYRSVLAHLEHGYTVYPVNPKGGKIAGLTVYPSLRDVPTQPLTRISVYLPPTVGITVLDEIFEVGCDELFLNPGTVDDELIVKAETLGLEPIQACSIVDVQSAP